MPTRVVTILSVIQTGLICACYLTVLVILRSAERWNGDITWIRSTGWYRLLSFVRYFFWLLLMIPVVMTVFCGVLARSHRDITWLGPGGIWLAVAVTVACVFFSAFTLFTAFDGPPTPVYHPGR